MILHLHQYIFLLFFSVSVLSLSCFALTTNGTSCIRSCGRNLVQYPFGFSDGCEIKLDCFRNDTGIFTIGDFDVQNLTSDQVLVSIPARCDRPIDKLSQLFGSNFAPTWRNELLLENCNESVNDCGIPNRLIESRIAPKNCSGTNYSSITCYSVGSNDSAEFLDYKEVTRKGSCSSLLSSIMVDPNRNSGNASLNTVIVLDFQIVELGWWLNGGCSDTSCDPNANCTTIGTAGYRCKCSEGYVGDGFSAGTGCRKGQFHFFTICNSIPFQFLLLIEFQELYINYLGYLVSWVCFVHHM